MSEAVELNQTGVLFTVNAANKVASLIEEEGNPLLNLRVTINGGGCSGFQYNFSFDEIIRDDDHIILQHSTSGQEVKLLIDFISYQYLSKAEIDYVENIQGGQLVIRNPEAKTTCSCGSSFSMDDDDDDEDDEDEDKEAAE